MKIIGLTGGIGMGKSTASATFRRLGLPIFDADQAVHALQAVGGRAVRPIEAAFPGTTRGGAVHREALRRAVLGNPQALKRLERIMHPLVRDAERQFLAAARRGGKSFVVLDIPLLLETGGEKRVDLVVVVSAPAAVQAARVMRRPGMSPERLAAIRARQMPDAMKRRRADVVIHTGLSRHFAVARLRRLMRRLRGTA
ncbi:MAG: dephospho-CoA kinase [Roseomonas sp.]|nr:dephospho-CoA kinase [Roseomonas sp.]MCA3327066.1 dephospho-CoA kinase [Roseomonas sp.]MCA3330979.1 dephospho-CoA kinase [Roseomonas sp.]MCA3334063.1 dephospho-CoA kinase [Roseomonas sp.]MCA3346084.1 dephospho-CoA kinase [Roseomonas sp.]